MDPYYLCKVKRARAARERAIYCCLEARSLRKHRQFATLLRPSVQNMGDSAYAIHRPRNEAAVSHALVTGHERKKIVTLSTCFTRDLGKPTDPRLRKRNGLGYDHFNQHFMASRFPHQSPNDTKPNFGPSASSSIHSTRC